MKGFWVRTLRDDTFFFYPTLSKNSLGCRARKKNPYIENVSEFIMYNDIFTNVFIFMIFLAIIILLLLVNFKYIFTNYIFSDL